MGVKSGLSRYPLPFSPILFSRSLNGKKELSGINVEIHRLSALVQAFFFFLSYEFIILITASSSSFWFLITSALETRTARAIGPGLLNTIEMHLITHTFAQSVEFL